MRFSFASTGFAPLVFGMVVTALLIGDAVRAEQIVTLTTADGPRRAILLPAAKIGPNPTIFVLHGATMSAERLAHNSGFAEAAALHGFTAVFPEGKTAQWNDARGSSQAASDDIGFLNTLAHQLIDAKIADPQRLYLAGLSNGGMMAFTLICQQDAPFTGIATILAALPANLERACHPPKPMPIVMMNGTADPLVPFNGGHVGFFGRHGNVLGVERTAQIFANAEACDGRTQQPLPKRDPGESTHMKLVTWIGCAPQASVRLYEVEGGGHQIPGGPTFVPFLFGKPNHDIRAADAILDAFAGS